MVIRFLIANAFAVGGTVRTTMLTAGALAERHDVEVVSVYRLDDELPIPPVPAVRVRTLADLRPDVLPRHRRRLARRPSRLIHPEDWRYRRFNLLTDVALLRFLRSTRDGVLVGTRPGLNLAVARHARTSVVCVGQDHMSFGAYPRGLREAITDGYGTLDAVTALTEGTAVRYRKAVGPGVRVECVPNPAQPGVAPRSALDAPVVVAAGSLTRRKGFDRLLRAWARVAPDRPGWTLEVFGAGPEHTALERLAAQLGVAASVRLRGYTPRLPEELAQTSVFAMTSRLEGFPMVLLEAMAAGVPVVAYDCPTGPADILGDGPSGALVPDGRARLFAEALAHYMDDAEARRGAGAAALERAGDYRLDAIAERWERLFEDLLAVKRAARGAPRGRRRRATA